MRGSATLRSRCRQAPKVASTFSHRGYNCCANLLRTTLPERDIVIGSASAFWQGRIHALNANVARRMQ